MKTTNLRKANAAKLRKSLRPRRRPHDPMLVLSMSIFNSGSSWERIFDMLVLSMSIFNSGSSWERIFDPIRRRENVWA